MVANSPFKSASSKFEPRGVYFGVIKSVSGRRLGISVPRLTGEAVFQNVEFVDGDFTTAPQVGERVFVTFKEGRQDDIVVLGRMSSSLTTPYVDVENAVAGDYLQFDGTSWVPSSVIEAYSLNDLSDVTISDPEEFQTLEYNGTNWQNAYASVVTYARNVDTVTLATGTCVYLYGATGDHATVKRADNSSDATSSRTVGVVGAPIAVNENGPIITLGYVDGIDLSSGYSPGDVLWLGSNGAFTTTKPTAPNHLVFIGVAVRCNANGIVYVKAQNGYELDELHDVLITSPASGDFLRYNGSVWINDPVNLSTDTVGNYVATIAGTADEIEVSGSGSEGAAVTLSLPATINANTTGSAAKWTTARTLSLSGDASGSVSIDGSANATLTTTVSSATSAGKWTTARTLSLGGDLSGSVSIDGSANATLTATIAANSVSLGTDTTGDYVSTITAGTGVSISSGAGTGEGSTPTLAIGQSVETTATPSFKRLTLDQPSGTAPLTITSTTLVTNLNADLLDGQHATFYMPTGSIQQYAGLSAPTGWLFCNGSSISRTTYADLFSVVTTSKGTVTMTIASPCVVTLSSHGLVAGDAVYLTTTGALATGLTANTTYYVQNPATNTFNLNTSQANAIANSSTGRVNTSGTQSGTHTLVHAPWGGITTVNFAIPDLRGRIGVGLDSMGGTDAGRLSLNNAIGLGGGEQEVTLSTSQLPSHTHTAGSYDGIYGINNAAVTDGGGGNSYQGLYAGGSPNARITTNSTGDGLAHNNMQPYVLLNYIIKT